MLSLVSLCVTVFYYYQYLVEAFSSASHHPLSWLIFLMKSCFSEVKYFLMSFLLLDTNLPPDCPLPTYLSRNTLTLLLQWENASSHTTYTFFFKDSLGWPSPETTSPLQEEFFPHHSLDPLLILKITVLKNYRNMRLSGNLTHSQAFIS